MSIITRLFNRMQNLNLATVIVILGGGLTDKGEVPYHTQLRLHRALLIYQRLKATEPENEVIFVTLSGGTPHKPNPLDAKGFPVWEAAAAAKKLVQMGVPPSIVYEENFSLDTIGNVYFLRTVHIDPGRYQRMVVITNDWHMDRSRAIFEHVFSLPQTCTTIGSLLTTFDIPFRVQAIEKGQNNQNLLQEMKSREDAILSQRIPPLLAVALNVILSILSHIIPSKRLFQACGQLLIPIFALSIALHFLEDVVGVFRKAILPQRYSIEYHKVQAGLSDHAVLENRTLREKQSEETFLRSTRWQFLSMQQMHRWLFQQHGAYAASRHLKKQEAAIDLAVLKSY